MARTVKAPEERRRELLDCAQRLFFERGYDGTSVGDIIATAGVSKGAFYHYFASKEAVVDAIAERLVDQGLELARAADDPHLGAIERLNRLFASSRRLKVDQAPVIRASVAVMFRPENLLLRHRITRATIDRVVPVIAPIIAQGVDEGVIDAPDPEATAEMLLQLGAVVHEALARALAASEEARPRAIADLAQRLAIYEVVFNRALGLPDHTVSLVEPGFAEAVMRAP